MDTFSKAEGNHRYGSYILIVVSSMFIGVNTTYVLYNIHFFINGNKMFCVIDLSLQRATKCDQNLHE